MRKNLLAALAALALVISSQAFAADPPNFDFLGYAIVPTTAGGTLTMRSLLTNGTTVPTPIPLDFTTKEYTLVVVATLAVVGPPSQYNPASIEIWEDAISGGTAANYAVPSSFTDGALILSGVFDGNLTRNRFSTTLGNFVGKVDFTGGLRVGDLYTTQDWPFAGGWSRSTSITIPSGYQERWDGKIDLSPIAVESKSWGAVKKLYD